MSENFVKKIAFENRFGFQTQIVDLRLKSCNLGGDSKTKSSGSNYYLHLSFFTLFQVPSSYPSNHLISLLIFEISLNSG